MNKETFEANIELVLRMYYDHNYTIDDICVRLRYDPTQVQEIVENYRLTRYYHENKRSTRLDKFV